MRDNEASHSSPILLGRPFLKTAHTKIDVNNGILTMEFDKEVIRFTIFDAIRYPSDCESISSIDIVDSLTEQVYFLCGNDALEYFITQWRKNIMQICRNFTVENEVNEAFFDLESLPTNQGRFATQFINLPPNTHRLLPSVVQPPEVKLKPLPNHLKYAFSGENDTLRVIIASNLTPIQEQKLVKVLEAYKTALGWTVVDTKGISLSMCTHRIFLEEGVKPARQV